MVDQDTKEYYDNYFTLFASDGWKQFTEEVIVSVSGLEKSTLQQGSTDVFLRNSGYLAALNYLISYENLVASTWEDINREPDDADL